MMAAVLIQVRERSSGQWSAEPADGDGIRSAGRCSQWLPNPAQRADTHHRSSHRGNLGIGRACACPSRGDLDSEFQALAFHEMLGINEIRIFNIDRDASLKLLRNLAAFPTIKVIHAASVQEAVKGAHIVTTVNADKAYATILTPEMIETGMHINAVGGDCPGETELHADIQAGRWGNQY